MCAKHDTTTETSGDAHGPRGKRHKLWELEERFHCSVIGTCLSLDELHQVCRKAQISFRSPPTDHELHSSFVNIAGEAVFASRLVQKQLENKYRQMVRHFKRARSPEQLVSLWDEALNSGEVAGAFWALITHERVTRELLDRAYGEIHMLSHLAGATTRVDMQALTLLRQQVNTLEAQQTQHARDAQRHLQDKEERIRSLEERLQQAQKAEDSLRIAEQKLAELGDDDTLQQRLKRLSGKLMRARMQQSQAEQDGQQWQRQCKRSEVRYQRLERSLLESQGERDALEQSLASLLSGDCPVSCIAGGGDFQRLDLCGRNILYVGGRGAQNTHFRALVERANGHFMHHDGGREDSHCHLAAVLQKADAVLCPLDCISHNAVHRVKRFCKRNQKTLMLLPRSSLSAFSRGLSEVAA